MDYPQLASLKGIFIIIALIISTMFTIVVAGKVCQYFESKIVGEELK